MPLARLGHDIFRVTLLALVGFALLRWAAARFRVPGLAAALGAGGVAQ
ncbi:MAG TPA: hypothetical protein VGJ25_09130 [Gaiellaceae bacterium]